MANDREDTITAIATTPGNAALGIVRISGPEAFDIATRLFSGSSPVASFESHTVHYGTILRGSEALDHVLLTKMDAPRTYTGEDTVEITCHGGRLVLHKVLTAVVDAGARPADPGEFTRRAFLNGKMDLAQAEAVQELISAENELYVRAAAQQLEGRISERIQEFRKTLMDFLVEIEASIDFPEEDIEHQASGVVSGDVRKLRLEMQKLAGTYRDGRRIREGVRVVIAGKPNVGKSSLLNALLEKDRAITTHVPGTTRDTLQESLIWQGVTLQITDTAGIRTSVDEIEKEGVKRSMAAISGADLVLCVIDTSVPISEEDNEIAVAVAEKHTILVLNKCDLPVACKDAVVPGSKAFTKMAVSALHNTNIEELKDLIVSELWENGVPTLDGSIITSARHKNALDTAAGALAQAEEALSSNLSQEFVALHLREALEAVGVIVGATSTEEVLNEIFSRFCIGK